MSRRRKVLIALVIIFGGLVLFRVAVLPDLLVGQMAVLPPASDRTPTDVGIPFEDASFDVGEGRLVAWFVDPAQRRPLAFLLLHGDGESVADSIEVQALLHEHGYPSLVYDYAGYGRSEGRASMRMFVTEPRAALDALLERLDEATQVVVLGHSFGAAVAVEAFHDYDEPRLHSIVFNAGPPPLRDILHEVLGVPSLITMLLPNIINARVNAAEFDVPMLFMGSEADQVISAEMVRRSYAGATEPKQLLIRDTSSHNDLTRADPEWWRPVFEWLEAI